MTEDTQTEAPRAGDPNAASADSFRPDADADRWVEQLARPFKERPWAVIRELFQNASDAVNADPSSDFRQIEIAILDTDPTPRPDRFHFAFRDSGAGMDDTEFCEKVGILGRGAKRQNRQLIGQFGVGFYSTHAICLEVAVLSRPKGSEKITAWQYVPRFTRFYRLKQKVVDALLAQDFENHPMEHRRRHHGTSVYINVDYQEHSLCEEWLSPEAMLEQVRRDFFILPCPVYIANLEAGKTPQPIYDINQRDLSSSRLNLDEAPWDLDGAAREDAVRELLRTQFPQVRDDSDLPSDWYCFSRRVGEAKVQGLLYVDSRAQNGELVLCLKRMRVEAPHDVMSLVSGSVHGVVNVEPTRSDLDVDVTPQRDHLLRDGPFNEFRKIVEHASIDFMVNAGERLVDDIRSNASKLADIDKKVDTVKKLTGSSGLFQMLLRICRNLPPVLADIPDALAPIVKGDECPPILVEYVTNFVRPHVDMSLPISKPQLPVILKHLQTVANKEAERVHRATDREPITWSPDASLTFLKRVGCFLPVTVAIRQRRREGGFNVLTAVMPVGALGALDASLGHGVSVLLRGSAEDYLAKNARTNVVVLPGLSAFRINEQVEAYVLCLALAASLGDANFPKLDFTEHAKEWFQDIQTRELWIPLVDCFDSIINGGHELSEKLRVEVRGYNGDQVVPVLRDNMDGDRIVINAYNRLMQDLQSAYSTAADRNDDESLTLMRSICHELYHHALPAGMGTPERDRHALETRNHAFGQVLDILQKYNDRRG